MLLTIKIRYNKKKDNSSLKSKEVFVYSSDFVIHRITKQSHSQSCSKSEKNVI
jgi:hypothetical protein